VRYLLLIILLIETLICASTYCYANTSVARVSIIIDDIGYRNSDIAALTLPGEITFAVLPHTPHGKKLAQQAHRRNLDVMLHIPMEAENGKFLGPGGLTTKMNEQAFRLTLNKAFSEIPFAIGINNHMGSKLTKLYEPMLWTMRYLKEHNHIFVDSMTTQLSRAKDVAKILGVPTLSRQVFLDNQLDHAYIKGQFNQLMEAAKASGTAVAIAHPHPETIRALTQLLPELSANNIELVGISKLLKEGNSSSNVVTGD